jgi:hypothetical protein
VWVCEAHVCVWFCVIVCVCAGDDGGSHLGVVIGVTVTLLVLCVAGGAACYVKRKALTDWLLWRLGNFRFDRFRDSQHTAAGEGNGGHLQDSRPLPLASAASSTDTLTLSEPAPSPGGGAEAEAGARDHEHAKLTLSSDSERAAPDLGVGHEAPDDMPIRYPPALPLSVYSSLPLSPRSLGAVRCMHTAIRHVTCSAMPTHLPHHHLYIRLTNRAHKLNANCLCLSYSDFVTPLPTLYLRV